MTTPADVRPPHPAEAWLQLIQADDDGALNLSHKSVSRIIYGLISVLALLQVMDVKTPTAWSGALLLFGTTLAIALAYAYAESIALMLTGRRALSMADLRQVGRDVAPILVGAQTPTLLLLLAALGVFSAQTAIDVAQGVTFALLFAIGMRVGAILHEHWFRQIINGLLLMGIGGLVVIISVFFK